MKLRTSIENLKLPIEIVNPNRDGDSNINILNALTYTYDDTRLTYDDASAFYDDSDVVIGPSKVLTKVDIIL